VVSFLALRPFDIVAEYMLQVRAGRYVKGLSAILARSFTNQFLQGPSVCASPFTCQVLNPCEWCASCLRFCRRFFSSLLAVSISTFLRVISVGLHVNLYFNIKLCKLPKKIQLPFG
jgi:hypothetical protein